MKNDNNDTNKKKKYQRAKEACGYMGIGLSTLWLYAKEKKITPIKLSERVTVFETEDLDNFISSCREAS